MRNVQYGLDQSDRLRTKKIAGKIIPAMATSTAAVSGYLVISPFCYYISIFPFAVMMRYFRLVSIEMIKVILGFKDIAKYKNAWVNLGTDLPFSLSSCMTLL